MSVTAFNPEGELIVVRGLLRGPRGASAYLNLVVDTGAAMTTVVPHVLDRVGYGAHMGERIARISSAIGYEDTYTIRIARLSVLGYEFPGLLVNAADLTDYRVIDGLLGLDILRRFDCTLQFSHGQIVLEPIAPSV